MKKKYVSYQLVADFGEVNELYYDYCEAFRAYQRKDEPKTLYGLTEQNDVSVIFSN